MQAGTLQLAVEQLRRAADAAQRVLDFVREVADQLAGRLALVELSPQKFNPLGQIQAIEGKTWNNLCLYGNQLLIRNGQEAACYVLP